MLFNHFSALLVVVGITLSGCGGGGGTTETVNQAPIADAGADKTVLVNETILISGSGTDSDGSIISYQWKKDVTVISTAASFYYTPTEIGIDTLILTVTDDDGATGSDMININVVEVDNTPPEFTSNTQYITPENKQYITSDILAQDTSEVSYTLTAGEDGSKFAIDSYDATLMFKEFPDYDIAGDVDEDNNYQATITATDTQNNSASQDITVTLTNVDESVPKTYQVVSNLPNGTTTLNLEDSPKDVYLLFTNTDSDNSHTATVLHNNKVVSAKSQKVYPSQNEIVLEPKILHAPDYVQEFNSNSRNFLSKLDLNLQLKVLEVPDKNLDIVGDEKSFCVDISDTYPYPCTEWISATSKKVISNIETDYGVKTLNIWVEKNSFIDTCTKSECVTQDMIDELATTFLRNGLNNDIYDWVTNIYGEEWGNVSGMIAPNDEITILLTDIFNDNSSNGGVVGFFWSKDNFKTSSIQGSNERVMFYIDSVMFANGDNGWDIDDYWPKEIISTLAHEFQHMIHFYQKTVLRAHANTDTWINEMLSESTEDLVATKIRHIGPRGVDYLDGSAGDPDNTLGRYPLFNANNTLTLPASTGPLDKDGIPTFALADYSKVNAFGAYLIRNYGGEKVLQDIMYNSSVDEQAVLDAVTKTIQGSGKTFSDLIHEWGISVLLSDHTDVQRDQYSYNTNDFTVSLKEPTIYKMGSINFFNYFPKPSIETTIGTIAPQGNYYYEVVTNQSGDFNITITKDANVIVSAVIKE